MLFYGAFQVLTRCGVVGLIVAAIYARKYENTHTLPAVHDLCVKTLMCLLVNLTCLVAYDTANLGVILGGYDLIVGSGITASYAGYNIFYSLTLLLLEIACTVLLVLNMYDIRAAGPVLSVCRLDKVCVEKDLQRIGVMNLIRGGAGMSFGGPANRLSTSSSSFSASPVNSSNHSGGKIAMTPMTVRSSSDSGASSTSSVNTSSRGVYTNPNRTTSATGGGTNTGGNSVPVVRTPSPSVTKNSSSSRTTTSAVNKSDNRVYDV